MIIIFFVIKRQFLAVAFRVHHHIYENIKMWSSVCRKNYVQRKSQERFFFDKIEIDLECRQKLFLNAIRSQYLLRSAVEDCARHCFSLFGICRSLRMIFLGEFLDFVGKENGAFSFLDHKICCYEPSVFKHVFDWRSFPGSCNLNLKKPLKSIKLNIYNGALLKMNMKNLEASCVTSR